MSPLADVIAAPAAPRLLLADGSGCFPVRRVFCVGRNFAEHAKEMGIATDPAQRGEPVLFSKPADAIITTADIPYPPATCDLHHEVELVVALGADAPAAPLSEAQAEALVFGYAIGLDLTRRDLQARAKAAGLPWDSAKGFDASAPISTLARKQQLPEIHKANISLFVNDSPRQFGQLAQMTWSVSEIIQALAGLYQLRAGDLIMMGTPAGVAALQPGDTLDARLCDADATVLLRLQARILNKNSPKNPWPVVYSEQTVENPIANAQVTR